MKCHEIYMDWASNGSLAIFMVVFFVVGTDVANIKKTLSEIKFQLWKKLPNGAERRGFVITAFS